MKKHLLFLLAVLLTASTLAAQTPAENCAKARQLIDKGKHEKALDLLNKCIVADYSYSHYFYLRSECKLNANDLSGSLKDLDRAVELAPDSFNYINMRGSIYSQMAQFRKALSDFDKAMRIATTNIDSARALAVRGTCKRHTNDTLGAINDLELAYRLDSSSYMVRTNLGLTYGAAGRHEDAIRMLLLAVQADSLSSLSYSNLGYCYIGAKQFAKAVEVFNKGLKLDPKNPYLWNNRGNAKYELGDLEGALSDINQSIKLFPENSYAYRNKGLVYRAMGERSQACRQFSLALNYGFTRMYGDEVATLMRQYCN